MSNGDDVIENVAPEESEVISEYPDYISNILQDIDNYRRVRDAITANNTTENVAPDPTFEANLARTSTILRELNVIKDELCKLPLDFCELQYFNFNVFPFLQSLEQLSRTSFNLSAAVNMLSSSPVVPRKKSKVKDTIDLIYNINEQCEDIYDVVKYRIDELLKCSK